MKNILTILISLVLTVPIFAQMTEVPTVFIDQKGIMRWSDTKEEASFYGVNYTLPFAYAYRALGYIGKDHKTAIDKDVYHFARLGFNAYRIHIWDVEISDSLGNLIVNEHLDLLDYLIAQLQKRNIRILLTAMTNFGNGYPEKDQPTGGFSYLYNKCQIHSDKDAIAAQKNYIAQFINHVNPYTQQSYKDDPYIVGFEINNEPCHADSPQQTEDYINQILNTLEQAGNTKPVFYNVSHNMPHVQAYFNTAIQGGTYQWYPTGLVAGHTRKGNFLPYVDDYDIPFSNVKGFHEKAKIVYEFDPADITYSYMYPAMARTFRSKGFQWITQFAYDPMDLAYSNTEYQTHFLNLAYTPQKALSMKIAAEVVRSVPLYSKYPKYPNDTVFGNFRVSYNQDLSELNEPAKFFYSNHTQSQPVMPDSLKEIAGYGNSPVVQYEGFGAYFLDRLEPGLWRLEVMPDAVQVRDPFEKTSLEREVVSILWNTRNMQIQLLDLGKNFSIKATNEGNAYQSQSVDGSFPISPGVYLLDGRTFTHFQLVTITNEYSNIDAYSIPNQGYVPRHLNTENPPETNTLDFELKPKNPNTRFFWRKYIKDSLVNRNETLPEARYLCLQLNAKGIEHLKAGFITSDGFTYTTDLRPLPNPSLWEGSSSPPLGELEGTFKIPLQELTQDSTALLPSPYPVFLSNYFVPDVQIPFIIWKIETLEISASDVSAENAVLSIGNIWLE